MVRRKNSADLLDCLIRIQRESEQAQFDPVEPSASEESGGVAGFLRRLFGRRRSPSSSHEVRDVVRSRAEAVGRRTEGGESGDAVPPATRSRLPLRLPPPQTPESGRVVPPWAETPAGTGAEVDGGERFGRRQAWEDFVPPSRAPRFLDILTPGRSAGGSNLPRPLPAPREAADGDRDRAVEDPATAARRSPYTQSSDGWYPYGPSQGHQRPAGATRSGHWSGSVLDGGPPEPLSAYGRIRREGEALPEPSGGEGGHGVPPGGSVSDSRPHERSASRQGASVPPLPGEALLGQDHGERLASDDRDDGASGRGPRYSGDDESLDPRDEGFHDDHDDPDVYRDGYEEYDGYSDYGVDSDGDADAAFGVGSGGFRGSPYADDAYGIDAAIDPAIHGEPEDAPGRSAERQDELRPERDTERRRSSGSPPRRRPASGSSRARRDDGSEDVDHASPNPGRHSDGADRGRRGRAARGDVGGGQAEVPGDAALDDASSTGRGRSQRKRPRRNRGRSRKERRRAARAEGLRQALESADRHAGPGEGAAGDAAHQAEPSRSADVDQPVSGASGLARPDSRKRDDTGAPAASPGVDSTAPESSAGERGPEAPGGLSRALERFRGVALAVAGDDVVKTYRKRIEVRLGTLIVGGVVVTVVGALLVLGLVDRRDAPVQGSPAVSSSMPASSSPPLAGVSGGASRLLDLAALNLPEVIPPRNHQMLRIRNVVDASQVPELAAQEGPMGPEEPADPLADGRHYIQIHSWLDEEGPHYERMVAYLRELGFDSIYRFPMERVNDRGEPFYRIGLGPYPDAAAASEAFERFRRLKRDRPFPFFDNLHDAFPKIYGESTIRSRQRVLP